MTAPSSLFASGIRRAPLLSAFAALAIPVLLAPQCPDPTPGLRVGVCERDITPVTPGLAAAYEAAFGVPAVVNHTDPVFMAGSTTTSSGRAASSSTARAVASRSSASTWSATS
jgi:hypothetical protein